MGAQSERCKKTFGEVHVAILSKNKVGHFYTPTNQLEFVEKVEKSCDQSTMNNRVGMDVEDRWGSAWSATW
jgi:hypothetical protein